MTAVAKRVDDELSVDAETTHVDHDASTSNYHSLQAQANRRFSHGLQFGGDWTWSKTMDFTDTDGGVVATYAPTRIWDYGKAGFDREQRMV